MRPTTRRLLWVGFFLVVLGLAAAPKLKPLLEPAKASTERGKSTSSRSAGSGMLRVTAVEVQPQTLSETVSATGSLLADESVDLQAEISGKVVSINFREGARVRAGDLLVKLNDAGLQATLRRVRYQMALAELRERRIAQLLKDGLVRQDEYDAALSEVNVRNAEVALTEAQIAETEIRAPFDGVVGLRFVSVGAFINASTQVATLQRIDRLKIDFSIPEKYAGRIQLGSPVRFTVAGSDLAYAGELYAYDPRIDTATRTVLIRARVPNPDGRLLPGAFASVTLTLAQIDDALMVPAVAVVPDLDERAVFVVKDGYAERRVVEIGTRTDRDVQILSGVQPGDLVITSGLQQLRPGMAVAIDDGTDHHAAPVTEAS